jgi:hypothetical protein
VLVCPGEVGLVELTHDAPHVVGRVEEIPHARWWNTASFSRNSHGSSHRYAGMRKNNMAK